MLFLFYRVRKQGLKKPSHFPTGTLRTGGSVQMSRILQGGCWLWRLSLVYDVPALKAGPETVVAAGSSGRAGDQRGPFRVALRVEWGVSPGRTQDSAPGGEEPTAPSWLSATPACRQSPVPS